MQPIIQALVGVHVVAALGLSVAAASLGAELWQLAFAYLLPAQAALVAAWGGLGKAPARRRFLFVGLASACWWTAIVTGMNGWTDPHPALFAFVSGVVAITVLPLTLTFAALKRWGPRLTACEVHDVFAAHRSSTQFAIKHLFAATVVVAAATAVGRIVRSMDQTFAPIWIVIIGGTAAFCMFYLVLIAVWACLAVDKGIARALAAITAAAIVSLAHPFYFKLSLSGYLVSAIGVVFAQCVMMLSLAVVRLVGYRVVARNALVHRTVAAGARSSDRPSSARPTPKSQRFQFSLGALLMAMFGAACFFAGMVAQKPLTAPVTGPPPGHVIIISHEPTTIMELPNGSQWMRVLIRDDD